MIVKICGITRLGDAELAVDLGATAIGFIFWPKSPRYVRPEDAREIAARLPRRVTTVGVFVDQPLEEMVAAASTVPLGAVQLHGDETPADAAGIPAMVIKAIPLGDDGPRVDINRWPDALLLLDVDDPVKRGGTGRPVNWERAAEIARRRRVLLAGGLGPDNVAEAVSIVRPAGIDVSSGVEASPGQKDPARLAALFAALKAVEA